MEETAQRVVDALSDRRQADHIRHKLEQLRDAIVGAREAGLTVVVPELTHLYLDAGTASGGQSDWRISRDH